MKNEDEWREWIPTIIAAFGLFLLFQFRYLSMKDFFIVLSGALTPLIAIIATYIAYQQYKINKLKVESDERASRLKQRHELYDRRLSIFTAVMDLVGAAHGDPDKKRVELFKFHRAISESYFLFGQDIIDYLNELGRRYNRLQYINQRLEQQSLPVGDERSKLADEEAELSNRFGDQLEEARRQFSQYISLGELGQLTDREE